MGDSRVQNRRVFILSHEMICQAGPQLVEGVEMLARILHPDLFPMELCTGVCLKLNLEAGRTCRPNSCVNTFQSGVDNDARVAL